MNFREPSPIDRFFITRARERPSLDLGITSVPFLLPPDLARADSGVTRWADFIIGFGQDEASRQNVPPREVVTAFEEGDLAIQAFIYRIATEKEARPFDRFRRRRNDQVDLIGSLVVRDDTLRVSGGRPAEPPSLVSYTRSEDFYTPTTSVAVEPPVTEAGSPHVYPIAIPEAYVYQPADSYYMPDEFRAAKILGEFADMLAKGLDEGTLAVRADLTSRRFGDLRGRGSA